MSGVSREVFIRRMKGTAVTQMIVSPFSVLGSILTLVSIFRREKSKRNSVYHRLMIMISVLDCTMSSWLMFGPLPLPEHFGAPGAKGTTASCTAYGFFLQLGFGSFGYSMCLMIYYVMVIRYNVPEERIAKRYEPFMHALTLLFFVGTAIVGLPLTLYNPFYPQCSIAASPFACDRKPDVECTRGAQADIFSLLFIMIPSLVIYTVILTCLCIVSYTVWQKKRQSRTFHFSFSRQSTVSLGLANQRSSSMRLSNSSSIDKNARRVQTQSLLYAITFLNSLLWIMVVRCFHLADQEGRPMTEFYWLAILATMFYPSQGIFNFLIYIRPRYLRQRESFPERGRWWALKVAIWYVETDRRKTVSNSNNSTGLAAPRGHTGSSSNLMTEMPKKEGEVESSQTDKDATAREECAAADSSNSHHIP